MFEYYDTDGSGGIDKAEYFAAMQRSPDYDPSWTRELSDKQVALARVLLDTCQAALC